MTEKENDRKARLAEYVTREQERLYRIAFYHVRQREAALDAVQEAILKAMNHLGSLRRPEYLETWFCRILINEARATLRRIRRRSEVPPEWSEADFGYAEPDRSEASSLFRLTARLPERLATVVMLRFFEELSLTEIAAVTRTNLSTVKSRLYRGLNTLKTWLEEQS